MKQPILNTLQHPGNHFFKWAWMAVLLTSLFLSGCLLFEQPPRVHEIALADLTGNGYLDAYVAIGYGGGEPYIHPDYILFNDGNGQVAASQEFIGKWPGNGVTLGDFTGNGLADVLLDIDGGGLVLYTNRGQDDFQLYSYRFSGPVGYLAWPGPKGVMWLRPTVGDLNGNGHLDIFAAGCCGRQSTERPFGDEHLLSYSQVWLNNGGYLADSGQVIGQLGSNAVALADLNGNGHLDAFLANGRTLDAAGNYHTNTPNTVWFNDGEGQFRDSGQQLGATESTAVALGDLNGNGFADAIVGNRGPDQIWFNDGTGIFSDSGLRLGSGQTKAVFLADLNGNRHLDLVIDGERRAQVWINDEMGQFTTGQSLSYDRDQAIAIGDATGNGHVDIFVAGVTSYQVWQGEGNGRFTAGPRSDYR